MTVLPDPGEIEAIARRIAVHATAARAQAHQLGAAAASSGWRGSAAEAFALTADDTVHSLRRAAARLDDAAESLHRHARVVAGVVDELHALAAASGHTVADLARGLHDEVLAPERLLGDAAGLVEDSGALLGAGARLLGLG